MAEYTVDGCSMTLSVETSRACGHLDGIDGERTPDGSSASAARADVRRYAQAVADRLGQSVEIYAQHPSAHDWVVDVVEPRYARVQS